MSRVVVTGMGLVTPLGCGLETPWKRLIAAESGVTGIQTFDVSDLPAKIAGHVPLGQFDGGLDLDAVMAAKDRRKTDRFVVFGVAAADIAIADCGLDFSDEALAERTGVMIGSGIGGLETIYETSVTLHEKGPRRVSPFFIPASLINLVSGQVSIKHGLKGPNHAVVTACATGAHAIGDAARMIRAGDADVMLAGGAEAAICKLGIAGFAAARALSTSFNDEPTRASRPWDRDRDGFVMGEGAGVVVLEDYERAKARGAKIYAEVIGYGMSGDAHHVTAPAADGAGGFRAMRACLKSAGVGTDGVDYINAHGTSTPLGDEIELGAVKRLFGADARGITMSSTKSAIGHLLGAAGAVEAVFSILAIRDSVAPPTLNLDNPSEGCDLDLAPKAARERPIRRALSNSFGFGGTNASVLFQAV